MHGRSLRRQRTPRPGLVRRLCLGLSRRSHRGHTLPLGQFREILDRPAQSQRDRKHCSDDVLFRAELPGLGALFHARAKIRFLAFGYGCVSISFDCLNCRAKD